MRDDQTETAQRQSADDTQLHIEPLQAAKSDGIGPRLLECVTRALQSRPELARKLSLGVLVALLLAIAVTVWQPPIGALFAAVHSTATPSGRSSVVISLQVQTPVLQPGEGWIPAGPSEAQHIIFAPSDPATAYTCGAPALSSFDSPAPIVVDVSRDYGHTWQSMKTPASGVECDLTVDPADAADVVLAIIPIPLGTTATPAATMPGALELYRSFDGGAAWQPWPVPADPSGNIAHFIWHMWAWAGTTLFVAPIATGEKRIARLAASIQRKPFAWVHQNGLFAGAPSDASINDLIGTPTALYVDLLSYNSCPPDCRRTVQTRDRGASWSPFNGQFQGQPVYLLQWQMAAGATPSLFGQVGDPTDSSGEGRTYVHAEDGGYTWGAVTSPPAHLFIEQIVHLPDGAIYADMDSFDAAPVQRGIYRLALGATSWAFVAPYPGNSGSIAITWDERGHALALWGGLTSPGPGHVQAGLETHAP